MRISGSRFAGLAVAGLAVVTLSVCGGGGDAGPPSGPTVPVTPVEPTPDPEPTPEPALSASCAALPPGDPFAHCPYEQATFQDQVDNAIRTLQVEQADLFDENEVVQAIGAYYVGLIRILDREGLCAYFDGEELGVTNAAHFNDQYDILTATGRIRVGENTYRSTCHPSAIPVAQGALPPSPAGCSLAPSREVACSRQEAGLFHAQVEAAVQRVVEEQPELFDFNDWARGTDWPRVLDLPAYTQAVIDILTAQGFCARDDGEEVAVKNENSFSEQYDIQYADKYIRTGGGTYRATCYPAAF